MSNSKSYQYYIFFIIIAVFSMAIGYATINNVNLTINGTASLAENGNVTISSARLNTYENVVTSDPSINSTHDAINFNISTTVETAEDLEVNHFARYQVTIDNDSLYDYRVTPNTFNATISSGNSEDIIITSTIEDAEGNQANNAIIPKKSSSTFFVVINLYPQNKGNWSIEGDSGISTEPEVNGNLLATIPDNQTGDLQGNNNRAHFIATVLNSFETEQTFTLSIDSTLFKIVDIDGNNLGQLSIDANTTTNYDFYIEKIGNPSFTTNTQVIPIKFNNNNAGIVSVQVDKDETIIDFDAPIISNVTTVLNETEGSITVNWSGEDVKSGVNHYVIETYQSDKNEENITKIATNTSNVTTYTTTVPNDGYYFFKIYGVDNYNPSNTATQEEINSCTTAAGTCSRSNNNNFRWNFTVTFNLTNVESSEGNTINVKYNNSVTSTLTGVSRPTVSNVTIKINGEDYNLNSNNITTRYQTENSGNNAIKITINNIIGDVTVTATATTCLAKGTNVLLANGKTKKIEDIDYDDLLAVWNYDTGSLTYEYPLWIENEHFANEYTKITFSDGTYINVINNHAFYNTDSNLFINMNDEKFKIGAKLAKIDNNGNFSSISIKEIEIINEKTPYYFVGTTSYYNIIANTLLTTDHNTLISNLYGFDNNAKWPKEKEKIVKDPSNILDYSYFKDVLPYYLYKGFRAGESGYLINKKQLILEDFKKYIVSSIVNPFMLKDPIQENGKNKWMVTTSEDNVNENNSQNFLKYEGSYYILPTKQNIIGWYNTSDNKIYKPGTSIIVNHGLHFIAKYN